MTELLEEIVGEGYSLELPKLFGRLCMKATGLNEAAELYKKLFVRTDMLNVSINSYYHAFDTVHNGNTSEEALFELAKAISITKKAWIRANDVIHAEFLTISRKNKYRAGQGHRPLFFCAHALPKGRGFQKKVETEDYFVL